MGLYVLMCDDNIVIPMLRTFAKVLNINKPTIVARNIITV